MNLEAVREDLINGDYRPSFHARQRMSQRNVTNQDIASVAETAPGYVDKDGTFVFDGFDSYSDNLTVVAAYENGVVIVTVFGD